VAIIPVLTMFALCYCIMSKHQSISDIRDDCVHIMIMTIYLVMIIVELICILYSMCYHVFINDIITECTFEVDGSAE
jgi:hypothetical protein